MSYEKLVAEAAQAREAAYAPYSGYKVGAAVWGSDGQIYTGANVENASYGLTVCAERNAVFKAVCAGVTSFQALAVVAAGEPAAPCGACRQVMAEFAPALKVIMANTEGVIQETSLEELLPYAFTPAKLREGTGHGK